MKRKINIFTAVMTCLFGILAIIDIFRFTCNPDYEPTNKNICVLIEGLFFFAYWVWNSIYELISYKMNIISKKLDLIAKDTNTFADKDYQEILKEEE